MSTQDIALFKAISAKMAYLGKRQQVIAQNIANADTPGYRPKDLTPVDFGRVLKNVIAGDSVKMATTDKAHIPAAGAAAKAGAGDAKKQKDTYEVEPTGNSVVIEEQLMKSGENVMEYNMMLNLYQKNMAMFRLALGTR